METLPNLKRRLIVAGKRAFRRVIGIFTFGIAISAGAVLVGILVFDMDMSYFQRGLVSFLGGIIALALALIARYVWALMEGVIIKVGGFNIATEEIILPNTGTSYDVKIINKYHNTLEDVSVYFKFDGLHFLVPGKTDASTARELSFNTGKNIHKSETPEVLCRISFVGCDYREDPVYDGRIEIVSKNEEPIIHNFKLRRRDLNGN